MSSVAVAEAQEDAGSEPEDLERSYALWGFVGHGKALACPLNKMRSHWRIRVKL